MSAIPNPDGLHAVIADFIEASNTAELLDGIYDRIDATGQRPTWISVVPRAEAHTMLSKAAARQAAGKKLPLFGVPFAIKDNIDLAGMPTTAACPAYRYIPEQSAFAVEKLIAAGAIPIGKTNLDQFATGLNGTRSPYGVPTCVFSKAHVSGGSSSGSAVAVASGLVPFALGTDTAGSGRIPAAFNNIVGLKPTKGLVSTRGVVPACRTQDCVSVLANTVGDALLVTQIAAGFDPFDSYSLAAPLSALTPQIKPGYFRFGVPEPAMLTCCGPRTLMLFEAAAARLEQSGGIRTRFDFAPFLEAAALLYSGPWIAERLAAIRGFAAKQPDSLHPIIRSIVLSAERYTAVDAFEGQYQLAALRRRAELQWEGMDIMMVPTAPFLPTVEAMLADPIALNIALGTYTNFVNLMDLSAFAVPAGFDSDGLPFGVTLIGSRFNDGQLAVIADRLHRALPDATMGVSGCLLPLSGEIRLEPDLNHTSLAVVGAHLSGQPLNYQLVQAGGRLLASTRTASGYSLYVLPGAAPLKPGLIRDGGAGGITLEVWNLPIAGFGAIVAQIPPPLGIGTIALDNGTSVQGFLCEPHALYGAQDITHLGSWPAFLEAQVDGGAVQSR